MEEQILLQLPTESVVDQWYPVQCILPNAEIRKTSDGRIEFRYQVPVVEYTEDKERHEIGTRTVYGYFKDGTLWFEDPAMMTASEADERWAKPTGTVRVACNRGRFDDQIKRGIVRKSAGTWLLTERAMREVFGDPKIP